MEEKSAGGGELMPTVGTSAMATLAQAEEDFVDGDPTRPVLTQGEAACVEKTVKDLLGPDQKVGLVFK